jgi:hypothetical protein
VLVLENSSVPLIPYFPSHKKSDGRHALMLRHQVPPIDEGESSPSVGGKKMKTKPILDKRPNTDGKPAMDEEMLHRLEDPIAKGAITAIIPMAPLQTVTSPNPILDKEP